MNDIYLVKKEEVIKVLKNRSEVFSQFKIDSWVKTQQNYDINLFTILLDDNNQLSECWEILTNNIAVHFQSLLEKDIEIWNIYVLFVVKGIVDKGLKYKIEQDKYSTRKIVYDNFEVTKNGDYDLAIQNIIDNKLFGFQLYELKKERKEISIQTGVQDLNIEEKNVEEMIKQTDEKLYRIIKYVNNNINAKPEKLFDIYMG